MRNRNFELGMECDWSSRRSRGRGLEGRRRWPTILYGSDEAISTAGQRFDVARAGRGISQGFAHFVDGRVQAVIEVDERIGGPEFLLQLFAGDDFSGTFQ